MLVESIPTPGNASPAQQSSTAAARTTSAPRPPASSRPGRARAGPRSRGRAPRAGRAAAGAAAGPAAEQEAGGSAAGGPSSTAVAGAAAAATGCGTSSGSPPPVSRCSRQATNWPSSLSETSCMTPRPNCAGLPVIARSVSHRHVGGAVRVGHRDRDVGAGRAVAALVLALGVDDEALGVLVLLHEGAGAVVDERDRAELDLDRPGERVAVRRGHLGAGEALRHRGDVLEVRPGLLDAGRDGELVASAPSAHAPAAASTARRVSTLARWLR